MVSPVPASVENLDNCLVSVSVSEKRRLQRLVDEVLDLTGQKHFLHYYLLSLH